MTTITNTAAFAQYRRIFEAVNTTANGGTLAAPTNTALLYTAGPDGSLITKLSSMPRATNTATQVQIYKSPDGGTTFNLLNTALIPANTVTTSAQVSGIATTQLDGTVLNEGNPLALTGRSSLTTSLQSTPVQGGTSQGAANVQTLPGAIGVTALTSGIVVDFEAGLTNSTTTTLGIGTATAAAVVRDNSGAALSAGDITAGFRYRVWCDGTSWRLIMTDRLYVAVGITLAGGIVTTAQGVDF